MPVGLRTGPAHWAHSLASMLRWHLTSMRQVIPLMAIVQILIASGLSVGISLFFEEVTPRVGLFLGTGAAIITLIVVGLVVAPQLVAGEKDAGTYDFTASLPVPRSAAAIAWIALSAIVSIPAAVAALLAAAWRFDLEFSVSLAVVPATLLILVCGTMIGYAIAHGIERTSITQILSQVFAFGIIGFTPITYPPENLPGWLAAVHEVLPFYSMGVVFRAALTDGLVTDVGRAYLIVTAWTVAAAAVAGVVVRRRG